MKNIYLVGFMGTGKTTLGKIISRKLGKKFIETDTLIEKQENKKIADIFNSSGEVYFRILEKKFLKEISKENDFVVSCGGGLICNEENLKILLRTGTVFNLTALPKTIYERVKHYRHRPLLNVADPLTAIKKLMNKRQTFYSRAHYTIDTDNQSPQEITGKIIDILNRFE